MFGPSYVIDLCDVPVSNIDQYRISINIESISINIDIREKLDANLRD